MKQSPSALAWYVWRVFCCHFPVIMKKYHVTLTESERDQLKRMITKRRVDSQAVERAYVLLAADENQPV
jgi:hypothetical protein